MIALIDGDILAWRVATATEHKEYRVGEEVFRYKRDAKAWCEENGVDPDTITPFVVKEPEHYTYHNIESMIDKILEDTEATEYQIYISGEGNYRHDLAKTKPYKGNRSKADRPSNLEDVRKYLVEKRGALVVNGAEADDYLGIAQCEAERVYQTMALSGKEEGCPRTVICTIDKDLDMIPGLHYNMSTGKIYDVSTHFADYTFFKQVLTGDSTDNIPGIVGCGPKSAKRILEGCTTEQAMYKAVKDEYVRVYGEEEGLTRMQEMIGLIWIQREAGVIWAPDGSWS